MLAACRPAGAAPGLPATVEPVVVVTSTLQPSPTPALPAEFSGEQAYEHVLRQVEMGPRTPGSEAHAQVVDYIQGELEETGWSVEVQSTTMMDHPVENVIARRGEGSPWIILGAHYDSRFTADQDPDPSRQAEPVPGANDGASGVAVLLELARVLPADQPGSVWLVFFDAEDQGRIEGWDWILGSRAFVESLESDPDAVVIVDMIGDADLNIYQEQNSDPDLTQEIWAVALQAGYGQFIPGVKYSILDDHTPFLERGIRAIDIIDFDYPHWHTTADTADKVAPESLEAVGRTLQIWLAGPESPLAKPSS
ncbi:MAG TPA: M28 family peptidase [Anaerolineaceae bacterium]|nr:M28 family peptidase [Anaerolineaceae bacterium]